MSGCTVWSRHSLNPTKRRLLLMSKPLSLADHFEAEIKNLKVEHAQLEAILLTAEGLGYDFASRDNMLSLLRDVHRFAQKWTDERHNKEQDAPDENFIYFGIHHVAKKNNIPCSPKPGVQAVELVPIAP